MLRSGTLPVLVALTVVLFAGLAMGQTPGGSDPHAGPQGVSPGLNDPIAISVDQGSIGLKNPATTWDVNDLVKTTPGIVPSAYIFLSDSTGVPPINSNVAISTPWQLGLLGNVPVGSPVTNADNLDSLSLGHDYFSGGGTLIGGGIAPTDMPWFLRTGGPALEPQVIGGNPILLQFSVNREASGVTGSAVNYNKVNKATPAGSVYQTMWSSGAGTNTELYSASSLGLTDQDDLDALENHTGKTAGNVNPVSPFETTWDSAPFIFFSVDRDSRGGIFAAPGSPLGYIATAVNVQASLGHAAGDVFIMVQPAAGGPAMNLLAISETELGLSRTGVLGLEDDVDGLALCLEIDDAVLASRIEQATTNLVLGTGLGVTEPLLVAGEAKVLFSVKEGSIGLMNTAVDWEQRIDGSQESGDLFYSDLTGMNWLAFEATTLGLLETDELKALDTAEVPEPVTMLLVGTGVLGLMGLVNRRRMKG